MPLGSVLSLVPDLKSYVTSLLGAMAQVAIAVLLMDDVVVMELSDVLRLAS